MSVADATSSNIEHKVSPDSVRWQQQVNSSFEALIKCAYMEADAEMPRVDGGESPASISHSNCSVTHNVDWHLPVNGGGVGTVVPPPVATTQSSRHFECRSDSRDSGLGNDVDRRFEKRLSPAPPLITPFSPSVVRCLHSPPAHNLPTERTAAAVYNSKLLAVADPDSVECSSNERLYDSIFKKKFYSRQRAKKAEEEIPSNTISAISNSLDEPAESKSAFLTFCQISNANGLKAHKSSINAELNGASWMQQTHCGNNVSNCFRRSSIALPEFQSSGSDSLSLPRPLYDAQSKHSTLGPVSSWDSTLHQSFGHESQFDRESSARDFTASVNKSYEQCLNSSVGYIALMNGYAQRNDMDFCMPSANERRETLSTPR